MRAVICSIWTWPIDSLPICGIGIKLHSVNETMIDLYNNLQLQLCSAYLSSMVIIYSMSFQTGYIIYKGCK